MNKLQSRSEGRSGLPGCSALTSVGDADGDERGRFFDIGSGDIGSMGCIHGGRLPGNAGTFAPPGARIMSVTRPATPGPTPGASMGGAWPRNGRGRDPEAGGGMPGGTVIHFHAWLVASNFGAGVGPDAAAPFGGMGGMKAAPGRPRFVAFASCDRKICPKKRFSRNSRFFWASSISALFSSVRSA